MKIIKDPVLEKYGTCYLPRFTDEFKKIIELAQNKIKPFSDGEGVSSYTVYFKTKDGEVEGEYDCCDNEKCIKKTKSEIRIVYGKGTHVDEVWYSNDGDHERIETCYHCGRPLNEFMTWCGQELSYLEESQWDEKFLKDNGFLINCILNSSPTMDCDISGYAKHQGGKFLEDSLQQREKFFQRIGKLSQAVCDIIDVTK